MEPITFIHLKSIDSTNSYAKTLSLPSNGILCISAEEQTAGRGRFQRSWLSIPHKSLSATFAFELPASAPHLTTLGQILAVSFAKILLSENLSPKIKWPNDIQLSGKKISGILTETQLNRTTARIFLGIGINVNLSSAELALIDQPATSLLKETNQTWDLDSLLSRLATQFLIDLETFKQSGFASFHPLFETLLAYKGKQIKISDTMQQHIGICHSITADGKLNLLLPDGSVQSILSGDVVSDRE